MRMLQRGIVFVLMVVCLLPMQYGIAELAPDRVEFYRERTEEWEDALGDYVRWNYYDRAMFCAIYGRRPGDYLNDEGVQDRIPKFPPAECITYEEALIIAKTFLSEYEPRITEEYLSGLHVGSAYYDFWGDPLTTVTKKNTHRCGSSNLERNTTLGKIWCDVMHTLTLLQDVWFVLILE